MPITLDDNLALLVIRQLFGNKPASTEDGVSLVLAAVGQMQHSIATLTTKVDKMSQTNQSTDAMFQTELAGIQADMSAQTSVVNSMTVFVKGISDKLAAALASAQSAGATSDELAAIKALHTDLVANTSAIVAATTVNTTAASEPTTPGQPTATVDTTGTVAGTSGSDQGTATIS